MLLQIVIYKFFAQLNHQTTSHYTHRQHYPLFNPLLYFRKIKFQSHNGLKILPRMRMANAKAMLVLVLGEGGNL